MAGLTEGAVAEWTKATVLKTVDLQGSVGSNPTRSATRSGGVRRGRSACALTGGYRPSPFTGSLGVSES